MTKANQFISRAVDLLSETDGTPPAKLPAAEARFTDLASSQLSTVGSAETQAKVDPMDVNFEHQSTTENTQRSIQEPETQPGTLEEIQPFIQPLENQTIEAYPIPTVARYPETSETDTESTQAFPQVSNPQVNLKPENKPDIQAHEFQPSIQKLDSKLKFSQHPQKLLLQLLGFIQRIFKDLSRNRNQKFETHQKLKMILSC